MQSHKSPLQPSTLNDQFHGHTSLPFADYVAKTREMITHARIDLTPETTTTILDANSPREWSSNPHLKKGLLLIHGLYDSPFMVQDLGNYFSSEGLLTRSILLPGHGTVPGDLLNVRYQEWIKAVDYGVETLTKEVDQVFVLGFSLGGVLALHKALRDIRIKGVLLIAPAITIQRETLLGFLLHCQWLVQWLTHARWYQKRDFQRDYAKYESFTCNAVRQIYELILETKQLLQRGSLPIPFFLTTSEQDEVICPKGALSFFNSHPHPQSELLWYSKHPKESSDARMIIKNTALSDQRILDFSHTCLPISPNNPHYGKHGDYRDFLQYPDNQPPRSDEIFLGAASTENLRHHVIQRLSYNPDFEDMVQRMGRWVKGIS